MAILAHLKGFFEGSEYLGGGLVARFDGHLSLQRVVIAHKD